jgi:ATP-binding cassette, subfamily B (MDR/TAP), member 1
MWPFALLALACVPIMGFATSMEMKKMLGEDIGDQNAAEGANTPGGIVVETLLNMRTVSALTLEKQRYQDYENALVKAEPSVLVDAFGSGVMAGMSMFVQQWINALQMWFGGYILANNQDKYEFKDFLIANFAVLFALFGLGECARLLAAASASAAVVAVCVCAGMCSLSCILTATLPISRYYLLCLVY